MKHAMFVVDRDRHIRMHNARAAALLARMDLVVSRAGTFACRDPESHARVIETIRDLTDRSNLWLLREDGLSAMSSMHALRKNDDDGPDDWILITVVEPEPPQPDVDMLRQAFDLTPAEARVASLVAQGHSTGDCARQLQVKCSTLRTQLMSIYRKTGVTGRADLVRVALSMCPD